MFHFSAARTVNQSATLAECQDYIGLWNRFDIDRRWKNTKVWFDQAFYCSGTAKRGRFHQKWALRLGCRQLLGSQAPMHPSSLVAGIGTSESETTDATTYVG